MERKNYIYWQEDEMWIGYLEEYPDYWTQGETIEELEENLNDIYQELTRRSKKCIEIATTNPLISM